MAQWMKDEVVNEPLAFVMSLGRCGEIVLSQHEVITNKGLNIFIFIPSRY
jgi:hypothetical protein